jgi:hypothetical protein
VKIFLGILSFSILLRWSSQLIVCPLNQFTIFYPLLNSSSSRFVLIFHSPSSYLAPYILLNIFLSKVSRAFCSFFVGASRWKRQILFGTLDHEDECDTIQKNVCKYITINMVEYSKRLEWFKPWRNLKTKDFYLFVHCDMVSRA